MTNTDNITPFPQTKPPQKKREPVLNLPPAVQSLCLVNLGVFLLTNYLPGAWVDKALEALAFIPGRYFGDLPFDVSAVISPVTYMFLHAGWLHIGMNLGMLMAFGAALEQVWGVRKFLLFYFACGIAAVVFHTLFYMRSDLPLIGASGGISGLFGGVVMLMYFQGSMGQGYKKLLPFVLVWVGTSLFFGFFGMPGVDNPIAWTAHVGGFFAGMLLFRPFSKWRV